MADDLGEHFRVLIQSLDQWLLFEPEYQQFVELLSEAYLTDESSPEIPPEVLQDYHQRTDSRGIHITTIQDSARPIIFFADQNGIDVGPLLRLIRATEGRADWNSIDQEGVRDCVERAFVRYSTQKVGNDGTVAQDTRNKIDQKLPDNPDVLDLCKRLDVSAAKIARGELTEIGVAREFFRNNEKKARNMLRQARRYRHLWER